MPRTDAEREAYHRRRELRRELGLCLKCGKAAAELGKTLCYACRQKSRAASEKYDAAHHDARRASWRAYDQAQRDRSRASGLCTACGKCAPAPGHALCPLCNQRQLLRTARCREKKRRANNPGYTGDPKTYPYRLGNERPTLSGKLRVVRVALDAWSYFAICKHIDDLRERDRAEGRTVRWDAISQLVRTMILQHERVPCPVHRQTEEMFEHRLGVSLDERTVALLDAHAARHYDGNRSKALRDFLIAARLPPRWVAAVGGPRRYLYPDEADKE